MSLIEMKPKDIKILKEELWNKNNKKCPLLDIEVPLDKIVLDHIHKLKHDEPSEQKGTIRNAIEFRANSMEGKITNNWKRYFGSDESKHLISLPNFLRNLADYLEEGSYYDGNYYIHPNEVPKELLRKSSYNKLKKLYGNSSKKAKFPAYPKSKKLTKKLKELFLEFNLEPEFY